MDGPNYSNLSDNAPTRDDFVATDLSARGESRDSLFLQAEVTVPGWPAPVMARVRNLSPGGMLAESPHRMTEGTTLVASLPNIGPLNARCVWVSEGRFGLAFEHAIDPQAVRRRHSVDQQLPPSLLGHPRRPPVRARKPLRPI